MISFVEERKTGSHCNIVTGGAYIVNLLVEHGVDTVFGYPGTPILEIYNALSKNNKIKHILTRHEQGAIHAAEGYARVSDKCGVVFVTSGPGLTNIITGLMNAFVDETPLVVITGQAETSGENEFQDIDTENLTKSCVKSVRILNNINNAEKIINEAFSKSMEYPKGPCIIGVTKSVLEKSVENKINYKINNNIKITADNSDMTEIINILKNAKRPLIIAGGGCRYSENELSKFVSYTHIPVVNTMMASGAADNFSTGMIGVNGARKLNNIIKNADVVLALGVRFTNKTTASDNEPMFLPGSKIISINIKNNNSKNVSIYKEVICELDFALKQLLNMLQSEKILFNIQYNWIKKLSEAVDDDIKNEECEALTFQYVLNKIHKITKKYHPIITVDTGIHQIDTVNIFKTKSSRNFIISGGMGVMGFGLPAAVGAFAANPEPLILNITGDGSFQMNIQELGTCAQYDIPLKIILLNNSSLGMIKKMQKEKYYSSYQSGLINPDFIKIAQAYGILGCKIETKQEFDKALKMIFRYKKAVLLDIRTSDGNPPPEKESIPALN